MLCPLKLFNAPSGLGVWQSWKTRGNTMKKILLAAAAATIVSSPAFAASDNDDFVINATVPDTCTMQDVNDVNLGTLAIDVAAGPNALLLSSDSTLNTNQFWVSCNKTNTMTFTADAQLQGSRTLQPGDDATFTDKLNYRVEAINYKTSGLQPSWASTTGPANQTSRPPVHRQVRIKASVLAADNAGRPLAGNYTGTVTVTVTTS